ncbi:unnamed protein product (macronuclear) [Paramecium tetraurelia]|uniref:Sperm-tail PG-rich repeat protein n=1 Tax=Paramecium tetraurelia TaxID=5888 RepID=A0DAH8_PARTE|nr:uncharacterized protein GSPATT00014952001 [Paramecium tetraurelia]CAK80045.1 unnamed protein product [Paramecium tetraurelia]|eukprot:XP_001447442.1 hypothetical protein (macronuclear) [Paramecium tetraurelia strain d4-2]
MKFSQSPKSTFNQNFNPPPGYYIGNDLHDMLNTIKTKPPQQQFSKSDRFGQIQEIIHPQSKTVEGFDKIAYQSSLKHSFQNKRLQDRNYVYQAQSQQYLKKTQEVENKMKNLLIKQMENCLNQQLEITPSGQCVLDKTKLLQKLQTIAPLQHPGPGHYNSNETIIKPRVRGTIIKEDSKRTTYQEPFLTADVIYGKQLTNNGQQESELNLTQKQKQKKIKFLQGDDYNLEKLFEKEKKKKERQTAPPPGHYDIESQFGKITELNYQNQCFDSREPRFKYIADVNPGPGQYLADNQFNETGGYMSKLPRQPPKDNMIVPVGNYIVQDLSKPQRRDGLFPSSFGSGSKRMQDGIINNDAPGPGSYDNLMLKKKQFKYVFKKKEKRPMYEKCPESFGLSVAKELVSVNTTKERSKSLQKQQQSSMFSSSVQRFKDKKITEELGPGSYTVHDQFTKITFNKGNDIFGKGQRIQQQQQQEIGPGAYDGDYKLLKKNFVRDVHF